MREWLSAQHIPFYRIENVYGSPSPTCWPVTACSMNTRANFTYGYLLEYGGFQPKQCLPYEFTTTVGDLPFGDRPNHTTGRPYFDLSGTSLVLHKDDLAIPDTKGLERHLGTATENGQIPPDWEVIRLKCCYSKNQLAQTTGNVSSWMLPTNAWGAKEQFFEAMLWKDSALERLSATLSTTNHGRLDRKITSTYRVLSHNVCYCLRQPSFKKPARAIRSTVLPREPKVSLQRIQQQAPARKGPTRKIDRVYYSNLRKNVLRKTMMNFWLNDDPLRRVPFKRINAQVGNLTRDSCIEDKNTTQRCRGVVGLARTLLYILEKEPMNGTTLILEDDYFITDPGFRRIEASLAMVPDDWDLIRFDCRDVYQVDLQWLNPFVVKSNKFREREGCERCFFCGGTHAMIVREESVSKLKAMWGQTPFDDVDCIIGRTEWLNSYCINIGIGDMYNFFAEGSDIPKE